MCAHVKRPNRRHKEGIGHVPVVGEPLMQWSADILGPLPMSSSGNRFILVISDLFTKWVEVYSLRDQKAVTIAECFVDLFSKYSIPKSILTDQGTNFESELIRILCEKFGVQKLRCTPAHAATNGQTERFNRTVCDCLTFYVDENQSDWDKWLPLICFAFRSSVHSTTGYTPFQLVFGFAPRAPLLSELSDDWDRVKSVPYRTYLSELQKRLSCDHAKALERIVTRQERSQVPGVSDIQEGDTVFLKVQNVPRVKCKKLSLRFDGPYCVKKVLRPDYVIARGRYKKLVHGCNLKKVSGASVVDAAPCTSPCVSDVPDDADSASSEDEMPVDVGDVVADVAVEPHVDLADDVPDVEPYRTRSGRTVRAVDRFGYE